MATLKIKEESNRLRLVTFLQGGVGVGSFARAVFGPDSSIDESIPRYDGTTGKLIQGSNVTIDDADNLSTPGTLSSPGTEERSERYGRGSQVLSDDSVAIGRSSKVNSGCEQSTVVGTNAETTSRYGTAVGFGALTYTNGTAVGRNASAEANAVAVGQGSASLLIGTSLGHRASSNGRGGVSVGEVATTDGLESIAIGVMASASGTALAIGKDAWSTNFSLVIGRDAIGIATEGVAVGDASSSLHDYSVAIGARAATTADRRCTIGTIGGSRDLELQVGKGLAVFGSEPPSTKPSVTGSRGGNAVLESLLTALAATGLISDDTIP